LMRKGANWLGIRWIGSYLEEGYLRTFIFGKKVSINLKRFPRDTLL